MHRIAKDYVREVVALPNIDWIKIKNEYINTNISQRNLAKKYAVSVNTLTKRANREKWHSFRREARRRIETKVQQETEEKIISAKVDRLTEVLSLSDDIVPKIKKAINQLETDAESGAMIDTYKLRQLVQSIKDLKEIVKNDTKEDESACRHQQEAHRELIEAIRNSHNENT